MMITLDPAVEDLAAVYGSHSRNIRRTFPMIFHPLFQRSIAGISKIVEGSTAKGFIINLRPFGEFRAFGLMETMLFVFPEFQRQGIGHAAVSLLATEAKPRFFVSANLNLASEAFFKTHPGLTLAHTSPRYRIYKTS